MRYYTTKESVVVAVADYSNENELCQQKRGEKMENVEIRQEATKGGLKLWEVAEALGMTDSTFSRKLRRELPSDQRDHILSMIWKLAELKAEREAEYQTREEERRNADNADD